MATLTLIPNAAGTITQLTPAGAASNWDCVNDPVGTPDDDTTYVVITTGTLKDTYNLPNHTTEAGIITSVTVHIRCKKVSTADDFKIVVRSGGSYWYWDITPTYAWTNYSHAWTTDPSGGSWTWADIDNLEIGVEEYASDGQPRCTQVYAVVDYIEEGTVNREGYVKINNKVDREGYVQIVANAKTYRSGYVEVIHEELSLCLYDTVNNCWDNGGTTPYNDKIIKLARKENINKVSVLDFTLMKCTSEEDDFTRGKHVMLGTGFHWTTEYTASDLYGRMFFQGVITKVEKVNIFNDEYDLKIQCDHVIHTLASIYKPMVISAIRVYQSGLEKLCTPAYWIRDILSDVTYYNTDGSVGTIPVRIRRGNTYVMKQEYLDKNLLEILIDLCNKDDNIWYCHDDGFYFESRKPILTSVYFNQPTWTQNFENSGYYDAKIPIIYDSTLTANAWDLPATDYKIKGLHMGLGSTWDEEGVEMYFCPKNWSPYTQYLRGLGLWPAGEGGTASVNPYFTAYTMATGRQYTGLKEFNITQIGLEWDVDDEYWQPYQRSSPRWDGDSDWSVDAGETKLLGLLGDIYTIPGRGFFIGGRMPSEVHSPVYITVYSPTESNRRMWRTSMSISKYLIMSDQIRFWPPPFQPRMCIHSGGSTTGLQCDEHVIIGYGVLDERTGLTGIAQHADKYGDDTDWITWGSTNPNYLRIQMWDGNYTYLTGYDATGDGGDNSAPYLTNSIDNYEDITDWSDEIESFIQYVELNKDFDLYGDAPTDLNSFGFAIGLDHSGNGFKDYVEICPLSSASGDDYIDSWGRKKVNDTYTQNNVGSIDTDNITLREIGVKWVYNNNEIKGYVGGKKTDGTWAWSTGSVFTGCTWLGMQGMALTLSKFTMYQNYNASLKAYHSYVLDEFNNTLVEELIAGKNYKKGNPIGQYIVIGEKEANLVRVPMGKYPDIPEVGIIKFKTLKVSSNEEAKSAAKKLYEADLQDNVSLNYYDFFENNHWKLKPNKQLYIDGNYYYIESFLTDFKLGKSKITAGTEPTTLSEYIAKKTSEDRKQADLSSPISIGFEIEDMPSANIFDQPVYKPVVVTNQIFGSIGGA